MEPFASLATLPGGRVPRLLLNRELVGPFKHRHKRPTDVSMTSDLVESVEELVRGAGWEREFATLLKDSEKDSDGADGGTEARKLTGKPHEVIFKEPAPGDPESSTADSGDLLVALSELSLKERVETEVTRDGPAGGGARGVARSSPCICEDKVPEGGKGRGPQLETIAEIEAVLSDECEHSGE